MQKKLFGTSSEKEGAEKNHDQREQDIVMEMGNVIFFILYLKGNVEKYNTYDRKPEKAPEHLNFFHQCCLRIVTLQG